MNKKTVIITMAGLGTRFRKSGYACPKYEIKLNERNLFQWSLISLKCLFSERFLFITLKENNSSAFISTNCASLGINDYQTIELNHLTDGQATSVLNSLEHVPDNSSLIIFNIDTHINPDEISSKVNFTSAASIPCFAAEGDHWSFVRVDDSANAIEVQEKKRISNLASVGLYTFPNKSSFIDAYHASATSASAKERYIAPLYNHLIKSNIPIDVPILRGDSVYPLGTPAELSASKERIRKLTNSIMQ